MYEFNLEEINYGEAFDADNSYGVDDLNTHPYAVGAVVSGALGAGLLASACSDPGPSPAKSGMATTLLAGALGFTALHISEEYFNE